MSTAENLSKLRGVALAQSTSLQIAKLDGLVLARATPQQLAKAAGFVVATPVSPIPFALSKVDGFAVGHAGPTELSKVDGFVVYTPIPPVIGTFTVTMTAATSQCSVDYATADVSAFAGTDYTAASGTLVFVPGQTSKTVVVVIHASTAANADKVFDLVLSNPVGCVLPVPPSGQCVISTHTTD